MPGSQFHLNPLPAVQLSEHTGVLGVHSQAARLGTLSMHLQVRRGRHRLQRLVYRDPQEMLSPHSPPRESWASCSPSVDCFNVLMWNSGETKVQKGYKPFLCDLTYKTNPLTSSASLWKAEGNEQEWPLGNLRQLWKRDAVPWWGLTGGRRAAWGKHPRAAPGSLMALAVKSTVWKSSRLPIGLQCSLHNKDKIDRTGWENKNRNTQAVQVNKRKVSLTAKRVGKTEIHFQWRPGPGSSSQSLGDGRWKGLSWLLGKGQAVTAFPYDRITATVFTLVIRFSANKVGLWDMANVLLHGMHLTDLYRMYHLFIRWL